MVETVKLIEFSERLHEAMHDAGIVERNRNRALREWTGVRQQAAYKWLNAGALPTVDKIDIICLKLNVDFQWLSIGKEIKQPQLSQVMEKPAQYNSKGLDWITDRDVRILKNVHEMSEYDQSRYEEFSAVMVSKGAGQTSENE